METSVTIDRAIEIARATPLSLPSELVSLSEAHNRILTEDLTSKVDDPRFDNAAMDGWAVRSTDNSRIEIGKTTAGDTPSHIGPNEAIRIMTGAPMPQGADAIVVIEDGLEGPANTHFIRRRGENLTAGTIALHAGQIMQPSAISLAATMGYHQIPVLTKPRIAVISTGDELIPPGEPLGDSQIYESNSHGLCSMIEKMGGVPIHWPTVLDDMNDLRSALNEAGETCDAIITSGGVSMGERDFVRKIMEDEGTLHFWKVKMRPGGPPLFGTWNNTPLFGLPGNPVSSHVVFITIVAPWLNAQHSLTQKIRVRLLNDIRGAPNKVCLRRIKIQQQGDELIASTHTHQGSGNIHSMVAHNGLTVLPPNIDGVKGDFIDALWIL